jgi:TonB family protein
MTTTKPRVALYEFMPYGAPELLEAERAHMSRALLASTLLLTFSCAVLALVMPRVVARGEPDLSPEHFVGTFVLPEPPPMPRFEVPQVAPARPAIATRGGDVVPVDDRRADPEVLLPSQDELARTGPGPVAESGGGTGAIPAPPVVEVDPEPNDVVPVDEMPVLVRRVIPDYPDLAQDAGVEGTVYVQAKIGRDGRVAEVRIQPGRSIPLLDDAALAAVRAMVFTPALMNGHPVVVWVRQPVVFRLH